MIDIELAKSITIPFTETLTTMLMMKFTSLINENERQELRKQYVTCSTF
jgi:hypothetical protein